MDEVLILIGVIMIISGIIVFILGYKRGVPNTILWALFPILHGMHEFTEYFIENWTVSYTVERFEILFSISGSLVLLAAAMEYNGVLMKPIGKISSLIGVILVSYFIFGISGNELEEIRNETYNFGVFNSDLIRFLQGFFLTVLAISSLLITSLYLLWQNKKGTIKSDPKLGQITFISVILLGIYALFEGFNSNNDIFITLRAISLGIFIIVPIYFILVNKIGLQTLIVMNEGGLPLLIYNFPSDAFLSFDTAEGDKLLLASGFLTAISSFTGEILHGGSSFSLRAKNLYLILSRYKSKIYALQSININRAVEKRFDELKEKISDKLKSISNSAEINSTEIKSVIKNLFSLYY